MVVSMIGKGASEIRPVTLSEVEKILDRRQGTGGEFGFEQQTTLAYAKTFAHLKLPDAQEMLHELEELGVPPAAAVKMVDILPKAKSQLLLILAKDKTELSDKKLAQVEGIIVKYAKKAKKLVLEAPAEPEPAAAPETAPAAEGKEGEGKEGKKPASEEKKE
jgi:DNA-directed RNA polymerase subunit F